MKKIVTVFFVFLFIPQIVFSSQNDFDVTYYEINISIDPDSEIVWGAITTRAKSEIVGLSTMLLDLYDNMTIDSVSGNVSLYQHEYDKIEITLDNVYNYHEEFEVTVFYHGHPDSRVGYARPMVFQIVKGKKIVCTESCPYYARCWWPCKDTPADKPDSVDIKIRVPEELIVASNGVRLDIAENGDNTRTHHWQIKNPIATYLITVTSYEYSEFSDIYVNANNDTLNLMYFVFPHDSARAAPQIKKVPNMIKILSNYYGEYPFLNEKYGMAQYVGDWAAMEYQTLSCFNSSYITDEETVLHELSHQWWGDCVSPENFHHTWISEGFAVFSEAIYWGEIRGPGSYFNHINSLASAFSLSDTLYQHDISTPNQVYPIIVYHKGAWVLHMLRHVVGDNMFWLCLQEYRRRHEYSSATTEDLQAACEAIYGESLEWFFHQWVYEPSYPKYNYGWWQEEIGGGNYKISGFIDRIRTNFKMPLDITVTTADVESTKVVWVDSSAFFEFELNQQAVNVELDKDNWVMKEYCSVSDPIIQYHHHHVSDSTGNDNGLAEAGENITLWVSLINRGIPTKDISVSLTTTDQSIEIKQSEANINELTHNQSKYRSFNFYVSPAAKGHLSSLKLNITAADNFSTTDSLFVKIGNPNILLVDDDNGADYEQYFYEPLNYANAYAGTWEVTSLGCPTTLTDYAAVIWLTGDDRTTSLTTEEQQALTEYLNSGGRLLITGQDIGYDLVEDGTVEDSTFYANYLHAHYIADSTSSYVIYFVTGEPITNGIFFYLGGTGNQASASCIEPMENAYKIFKWLPGNLGAGVRYEHPALNYRVVYLAFGLEGVDDPTPDSKNKLIDNILNWFAIGTGMDFNSISKAIPDEFGLSQNYPNPFNCTTTINYQLAAAAHVEIEIFNLLGQKIKSLVSKYQQPNYYRVNWDGNDNYGVTVSSGIYVYRIKAGNFIKTNKLLFLK